jgi:N-acetylneuraminic acid mutarotase
LPGRCLLITGGDFRRKVMKIDTLREYAVSSKTPMHTGRMGHAAVYHSQYLYVLGGWNERDLNECERYSCEENRWEVLPALSVAGFAMSAVKVENSVYALGGTADEGDLDTIQRLSLDSLTWELMQLKLPQPARFFASFTTDTEVYLMIKETLYSFTPLQVKPIKTLPRSISRFSFYYS